MRESVASFWRRGGARGEVERTDRRRVEVERRWEEERSASKTRLSDCNHFHSSELTLKVIFDIVTPPAQKEGKRFDHSMKKSLTCCLSWESALNVESQPNSIFSTSREDSARRRKLAETYEERLGIPRMRV